MPKYNIIKSEANCVNIPVFVFKSLQNITMSAKKHNIITINITFVIDKKFLCVGLFINDLLFILLYINKHAAIVHVINIVKWDKNNVS